jgi:hypothetical protein
VSKTYFLNRMKKLIFIMFRILLLLAVFFYLVSGEMLLAQEGSDSISKTTEKINPSLKFSVLKNNDGTRTLNASFAYRDKETKEFVNVKDIPLTIITGTNSVQKIGIFKTDQDGKVKCDIPVAYKYSKNDSGYIHFAVEFEGDAKFEATSSEIDLVDLQIKLSLEVIDSVRTVKVEAAKILNDDKTEPLNGETITISIGRMFSHLKVGEIALENGLGTFEFPMDILGDSLGMVTIIAKFEDHEIFGSILKSEIKDWGIKTYHHTVYHPRSLWTAVAPIWMIITLSIMLLGVWGHYIYVILQLIRLKRIKPEIIKEAKT